MDARARKDMAIKSSTFSWAQRKGKLMNRRGLFKTIAGVAVAAPVVAATTTSPVAETQPAGEKNPLPIDGHTPCPKQRQALNYAADLTLFYGGRGCGKSWLGREFLGAAYGATERPPIPLLIHHSYRALYLAPNWFAADDARECLAKHWREFLVDTARRRLTFGAGASIDICTFENFSRVAAGYEYYHIFVDNAESGLSEAQLYAILQSRYRKLMFAWGPWRLGNSNARVKEALHDVFDIGSTPSGALRPSPLGKTLYAHATLWDNRYLTEKYVTSGITGNWEE